MLRLTLVRDRFFLPSEVKGELSKAHNLCKESSVNSMHLQTKVMKKRREFLRNLLVHTAYTTPLITSFLATALVRAASCPGLGDCGKSSWAMDMM
jgi:hypothetical protein